MSIKTKTAQLIVPAGATAGTVQFSAPINSAQGSPFNGVLMTVIINPQGHGTGLTTVISSVTNTTIPSASETFLTYVGNGTPVYHPRPASVDNAGTNSVAANAWYVIDGMVQMVCSGATAGGTVTAVMQILD